MSKKERIGQHLLIILAILLNGIPFIVYRFDNPRISEDATFLGCVMLGAIILWCTVPAICIMIKELIVQSKMNGKNHPCH
jgi:hypothetical protein